MKKYLYVMLVICALASCESDPDCPGFKEEPRLGVQSTITYDSIYSVKSDGTRLYAQDSLFGCYFFEDVLPINITKDEFTFFLRKGSVIDTVVLSYKLNGQYHRGGCDYSFNLDSMKVQRSTTPVNKVELTKCDNESYFKLTMP